MKHSTAGKQKGPFISLVWKTILAVGFVTILASGAIVLFGKLSLDDNYRQERARVHRFYRQAFDGILQGIKNDRVDIAWLIPAFLDETTHEQNALNVIREFIERNWFQVELESDIESAFLFTVDRQLVGSWGNTLYQGQFSEWLDYVVNNEKPFDEILCEERCIHFHATPFLHNGNFVGIFIFGIDLADAILKMRDLTGSDIGIVTQTPITVQSNVMPIENWSSNLVALTDSQKKASLVLAFSRAFPDGVPKEPTAFAFKGAVYEIIPLSFNDRDKAVLLILEDISRELSEIKKATGLYALSGLLSLLLSGGVLLILLIGPTRKLKRLIALLPLIARKQYDLVAGLLLKSKKPGLFRFRDEIDILESTSHQLIFTLQELDDEVNIRTNRLYEQALELQFEKNFIDTILNNAQVIILTLDLKGRIKSVNQYTKDLTQYSDTDLLNDEFYKIIPSQEHKAFINDSIKQLCDKNRTKIQYECPLYTADGSQLYISWFFSPLTIEELEPEILIVGLDLTDRRRTEKQLTWLAEHDPLTGLYNRRKFERELDQAINMANRYRQNSALIFFDIDQFKYVNDSSGHRVGDELLIKVAEKLRTSTRETDVIARFGGDEFIVLAPQITQKNAEELVQKICHEMTTVFINDGNQRHRVSVSAGLLMFPEPNCTAQDLLATADVAMYKAKEAGRGGWRLANSEDIHRREIKTRVNWKTRIEKGLSDRLFQLHYQPIMCIKDQSISHYECLLRMVDEETGRLIPPGLFIEVAEQTGLIFQIDMMVVELAFCKQVELIEQGFEEVRLAINLSGDTLSKPEAFGKIDSLLKRYRLRPSQFIFEVTETQAVTNLQAAHDFIDNINEIGGSFALDDFGVGFSSLNYLRQLPVEYLKIDGSFVKNITDSLEDQLFVTAINSVGHGLGLKTIAEFVENDAILDKLSVLGVDYAQGYSIGKPMAEPEFHRVKNHKTS